MVEPLAARSAIVFSAKNDQEEEGGENLRLLGAVLRRASLSNGAEAANTGGTGGGSGSAVAYLGRGEGNSL